MTTTLQQHPAAPATDTIDDQIARSAALLANFVTETARSSEHAAPRTVTRPAIVRPQRRARLHHSTLNFAALLVFLTGLLCSGLCLYQGKHTWHAAVRPIQTIRVGQAVRSENPTGEEDLSLGDHVDRETWRHLILKAPKLDGSWADVELIRPLWWLKERAAQVGQFIDIDVPHCGIEGEAEVLAINPCPALEPTPKGYRTVTGTFHHHNAEVIDLYVEGLDQPIGTTPNHPFWSEDRQDFIRADELQPGEGLRDATGRSVQVLKQTARTAINEVFNLEVHCEHTYCVASSGLLVHNSGPLDDCPFRGGPHKKTTKPRGDNRDSHHTPAKSVMKDVLGVPNSEAPAIQMDVNDHIHTSSNGRHGVAADQYREETADLIKQGKLRDAMAMEIRDVRRAAEKGSGTPSKYNKALKEMLEYSKDVGFIPE